ncbi:glutathione s-transferase u8 [Quercus suber]|uniref:Glutathione s-transferase u8 n=1 Tax=Quercus suber TaxID=58331 RepID=A0AAW0JDX7_QUESU
MKRNGVNRVQFHDYLICFVTMCFPAILKACWGEDQKEREKAAEELSELLQFLENELKERETIGLLDIAANMISYWLGISEEASGASELLTREKFPKLFNWANEFVSVSAIKESLPPRDKHVAVLRKHFGMVNASK